MKFKTTILFILLSCLGLKAQDFYKLGVGFEPKTFFHQQNINYFLNCPDEHGNVYTIHYDTVSSSFNFGQEFTQIRLRIFNGISWLHTTPVKLYSKYTVDAPRILDIKYWNGSIYICGSFDSSENNLGAGILIYDGAWKGTGMKLMQTNPDYFEVNAMHISKDGLMITGNFDSIPGYRINGMLLHDNSDWKPIGGSGKYGFQGLSGSSNVFFYGKDSMYAYNKNKIKPDSIEIGERNFKKLGVYRNGQFEALSFPYGTIAALSQYQNNLIVIPSSNLIYISHIRVRNGTQWNKYDLPGNDSFYATNYLGSLESNNVLYLLFQSPNEGIITYHFNGTSIKRTSVFRLAESYINLEFNAGLDELYLSGNFHTISQGQYSDSFRKIVKVRYQPRTIIHGYCYNDLNGDKTRQSNEPFLSRVNIVDQNKRMMAITNGIGQFTLRYPVSSAISLKAGNNCGLTSIGTYDISLSADSVYEMSFALSDQGSDDLAVYLYSGNGNKVKQGFKTRYLAEVTNTSKTASTVQVKLNHDKRISLKNFIGFTPDLVQSDAWIKTFVLEANSKMYYQFECTYSVDSFTLGETILPYVEINTQDNNLKNNHDTIRQTVVSAYDPNIKVASPSSVKSSDEKIKYVIYFENLGNDTALNVTVVDSILPFLELSSIVIGGSSHPYRFNVENNCLIWSFEDIRLPARKQDSIHCSGFVTLRSHLSQDVKIGDTAYNKAAIFFDYQKPVITNKAKVVFRKDGSVQSIETDPVLKIYPNPGNGVFTYNNESSEKIWFIYDINGRRLAQIELGTSGHIDLSEQLSAGVYFIRSQGGLDGGSLVIVK